MSFLLDDLKGRSSSLESLKKRSGGLSVSGSPGLSTLKSQLIGQRGDINSIVESLAAQALPSLVSKLNENTTELIFIFDRSGSCKGTEKATCVGFVDLISKEQNSGYDTKVTTILFNEEDEMIHYRKNIKDISGLNYSAFGGTALYDSLCNNLTKIKNDHLKFPANVPKNTVVVIMTDGYDEHSVHHNLSDAKAVISECRNLGWEFIFLGTKINAKDVAVELGIDSKNAENYNISNNGILLNFQAVSKALTSLREEGEIKDDWSESIVRNNTLALGDGQPNKRIRRLGGR